MILRFLRLLRAFREAELDRDEARRRAEFLQGELSQNISEGMNSRNEANRHRDQRDLLQRQFDASAVHNGDLCKRIAEADDALRAAEARIEAASGAKIEAQDRVRDLEAHVTNLNGALAAAYEKEAYSVKCVADWMAIQRFGVPIYGVAPPIPEGKNVDAELVPRAGVQGRVLAQQMEDAFFERTQ